MKRKIILSTSLLIFFTFLIIFFTKSSNDKNLIEKKKVVKLVENENIEILNEKIESLNIIEDVSYSAKDIRGNEYFLKARGGTIDQNESNN